MPVCNGIASFLTAFSLSKAQPDSQKLGDASNTWLESTMPHFRTLPIRRCRADYVSIEHRDADDDE
jgi:hypothetical protein